MLNIVSYCFLFRPGSDCVNFSMCGKLNVRLRYRNGRRTRTCASSERPKRKIDKRYFTDYAACGLRNLLCKSDLEKCLCPVSTAHTYTELKTLLEQRSEADKFSCFLF